VYLLHCRVIIICDAHMFAVQSLPLAIISPQTFSSDVAGEARPVVKVHCVNSFVCQHAAHAIPGSASPPCFARSCRF
jgi:hypothetical protein